jgi:hypothetical protein
MKIICTEQEKKEILAVIMKAEHCPKFLEELSDCRSNTCIDCLNNRIEWEITKEDNNADSN